MTPPLECRRPRSDMVALGIAANMLHNVHPFSGLPVWSFVGTLLGQITRKHYVFAARGDEIVGYAGWAFSDAEIGRAFAEGRYRPGHEQGHEGDCLVLMTLYGDTPEITAFLVRYCRGLRPHAPLFGRRIYPGGRARPVHLPGRRPPA